MSPRDQYVAEMKQRLDDWSAEMDAMEAAAHRTLADDKLRYQEQLSALHAKRQEGERQLAAIQAATDDSWQQLKAGTETVWDAFKDSVHQFKSHFN